jgi:iron only hydrogenase large subunit-like protein
MGKASLTPVIGIDYEKCINCYACIAACPVKYCMDGSGDVLTINNDMCIGCGNCISACTHHARKIIDDTARFFNALNGGEKIIAIAAPAVASVFSGNHLRLNGYLQSLGVKAVFDVSFGAELTVVSYLKYIAEKKPRMVIAQPCPAIVNYIEHYVPELLYRLAPVHSPAICTAVYMRKYKDIPGPYAFLSPCVAKGGE